MRSFLIRFSMMVVMTIMAEAQGPSATISAVSAGTSKPMPPADVVEVDKSLDPCIDFISILAPTG